MEDKEALFKKWLLGSLGEEEKKIFESTAEHKALEKLSKSLLLFKAPGFDELTAYEQFQSKEFLKGKVVAMNWLNTFLKVAAVLIAVAGGYFLFLRNLTTEVSTLAGEKKELILPDSSFVALNALSMLSFDEKKWKKIRQVDLDGEAFFKVAKGSRFDVKTSSGTISVLGTQFNVKNRKDYFEVICYEGIVEVQSANQVVKLFPKQTFSVISGVIDKNNIATDKTAIWMMNESAFKSVPFLYVIQEFERQYNVSIITKNVDVQQLFTGAFTHSDRLLTLKSITIPLRLTYHIADDKKIVLGSDIK